MPLTFSKTEKIYNFSLKAILFNARSICNKLTELQFLLSSEKYDAIFITETWTTDLILNSVLTQSSNYNIFRKDRSQNTKGGGVIAFIKSNITTSQVFAPHDIDLAETVIFDFCFDTEKIRCMLTYRSPNYDRCHLMKLCNLIEWVYRSSNSFIILGDFNFPQIKWGKFCKIPKKSLDYEFFVKTVELGIFQAVQSPTLKNNILDLILYAWEPLVFDVVNLPPFSTSDHDAVEFKIQIPAPAFNDIKANYATRDFRLGDYQSLRNFLETISWPDLFSSCLSVDDFYAKFLKVLNIGIQQFVPLKRERNKNCKKFPYSIIQQQTKKKHFWKKFKRDRTKFNKDRFQAQSKLVDQLIKNFYAEKERKLLQTNDLHHFYNFVNTRLKNKSKIPDVLHNDSQILRDDNDKANLFNSFFSTVFTTDNRIIDNLVPKKVPKIGNIVFTTELVKKTLQKLKPTFSVGPDSLNAFFLKKLSSVLAAPLSTIFEVSYRSSQLPKLWKQAIVVPVFKKKNPFSVENYRPISLCCVPCKIMETIINERMIQHFTTNKLLSNAQFGFSKRKSCASQLIFCKNVWSKSIDTQKPIDVIYIDFAKAFDSVVHSKLLLKLRSNFGIDNFLLKWIEDFLSCRQQMVKINNSFSNILPVISGVPQGSVLGPFLFNAYINDIVECIDNSTVVLFADDVKLFNHESKQLQADLLNMQNWCEKWQVKISFEKCTVLHLGKKNTRRSYFIDGNLLKTDSNPKDLGVIMDENLASSAHCKYIFRKCSQVSSLICKTFLSGNIDLMLKAYKIYVLPLLDYCSQIYNPHKVSDINLLERVQRKFTKTVLKNSSLSYNERINELGLDRLELRRIHTDLHFAYRILHNEVLGLGSLFNIKTSNKNTRQAEKVILDISPFKSDIRKFDFSCRVSRLWNMLPITCTNSINFNHFKRNIRTVKFDELFKGRE